MPEGHDADELRRIILERFDMSLGAGLTKLAGKVFRIGHLGHFNDLTLAGTLAGVQMGLHLAGVPVKGSGVDAALELLRAAVTPLTEDSMTAVAAPRRRRPAARPRARAAGRAARARWRSTTTAGTCSRRDASMYAIMPVGRGLPARRRRRRGHRADRRRVRRARSPPRGAGTCLAGQTVGAGLVLDLSRHMNRILDLDPEARTARVQPGVVQDDLNRAAAPFGLMFGPGHLDQQPRHASAG